MISRSQDDPIDIGPNKHDFPLGFMQTGDMFVVTEGFQSLYQHIKKLHESTTRHYVLITNRERTAKICVRVE